MVVSHRWLPSKKREDKRNDIQRGDDVRALEGTPTEDVQKVRERRPVDEEGVKGGRAYDRRPDRMPPDGVRLRPGVGDREGEVYTVTAREGTTRLILD